MVVLFFPAVVDHPVLERLNRPVCSLRQVTRRFQPVFADIVALLPSYFRCDDVGLCSCWGRQQTTNVYN